MQMQRTSAWGVAAGRRRWWCVCACAAVCVSLGACTDESAAPETAAPPTPGGADVVFVGEEDGLHKGAKAMARIAVSFDSLLASLGLCKPGDVTAVIRVYARMAKVIASRLPGMLRKNKALRHFLHLPALDDRTFSTMTEETQAFLDGLKPSTTVAPSVAPGGPSHPAGSPQRQATLGLIESMIAYLNIITKKPESSSQIKFLVALQDSIQKSQHFILDGKRLPNFHDMLAMALQVLSEFESVIRHVMPGASVKSTVAPTTKQPATSGPHAGHDATTGPAADDSTHKPTAPATKTKGRSHTAVIALCVAAAVVACCAVAVGVGRWRKGAAGALRTTSRSDVDAPDVELVAFGAEQEGGVGGAAHREGWTAFN